MVGLVLVDDERFHGEIEPACVLQVAEPSGRVVTSDEPLDELDDLVAFDRPFDSLKVAMRPVLARLARFRDVSHVATGRRVDTEKILHEDLKCVGHWSPLLSIVPDARVRVVSPLVGDEVTLSGADYI